MLHLSIPRAEAVKPRQIRITPTIDGQTAQGATVPTEAAGTTDANGSGPEA